MGGVVLPGLEVSGGGGGVLHGAVAGRGDAGGGAVHQGAPLGEEVRRRCEVASVHPDPFADPLPRHRSGNPKCEGGPKIKRRDPCALYPAAAAAARRRLRPRLGGAFSRPHRGRGAAASPPAAHGHGAPDHPPLIFCKGGKNSDCHYETTHGSTHRWLSMQKKKCKKKKGGGGVKGPYDQ